MPGQDDDGGHRHPRPAAAAQQPLPRPREFGAQGAHGAVHPRGGGRAAEPEGGDGQSADRDEEERGDHRGGAGRTGEPAAEAVDQRGGGGRRHRQRDRARREEGHLARGPFEDDRADTPAQVTDVPSVPYRTVHVTEDTAGQRGVQEEGTVVGGEGAAERQPDAQRPGDQRPADRAEHRGEQAESERGEQGEGVDPAQPVEERAGAQPPHQHREERRPGEGAEARPEGVRDHDEPSISVPGSASRSWWWTTTDSSPAAAAVSRRRR